MPPYYVGGSSAPSGRGAFPPYVGRSHLRRAGRPPLPTTTNVELNRQPERLSMLATVQLEPAAVPAAPQLRLQHQVILALDLGQTTGWAVRNADGVITHGTVQFRPGRHEGGGMPYLRFRAWLQELDETLDGIDCVLFEEVIGHRGAIAAQVFGGFLAHLSAWAEMNKIPYEGVPVATIKRHITGKGNATKEEVIAAVRAKGFCPVDDNDADALALLDWGIANRFGGGGQ